MNTFAVRGPMGRTVADLALLLGTLSGYDPTAPASLDEDPNLGELTPCNVHDRLRTCVRGRKIAWLGDWKGYLPMEDGVLAVCEKALESLSALGVTTDKIDPPYNPEAFWKEIWLPMRHFGSQSLKIFYDDPEKRKLLKPEAIFEYEGGVNYSANDLYIAAGKRSDWYRAILNVFKTYDYIAVPTAQVFAYDKTVHWPKEIAGRKMDTYHRWMEVVTHWTMTGCPVAAVPAGFNDRGLSMGIQLIGRPRGDFDLLQFAYAYETLNDWVNTRRPKILDEAS
jgi:amidase